MSPSIPHRDLPLNMRESIFMYHIISVKLIFVPSQGGFGFYNNASYGPLTLLTISLMGTLQFLKALEIFWIRYNTYNTYVYFFCTG